MPEPSPKDDSFDVLVADTSRSAVQQDHVLPESPKAEPRSPAGLTITIHSWATPVIGLAMLLLGLLAGFYGRPFLVDGSRAAVDSSATGSTGVNSETGNNAALMETVQAQVRHFRGSPDAPITLVEFSDFQ